MAIRPQVRFLRLTPSQRSLFEHLMCPEPHGPYIDGVDEVMYVITGGYFTFESFGMKVPIGEGQVFDTMVISIDSLPIMEATSATATTAPQGRHVCGSAHVQRILSR